MGEIAEMILEGMLCQECGEFMEDGKEYPHSCPICEDGITVKYEDEPEWNIGKDAGLDKI